MDMFYDFQKRQNSDDSTSTDDDQTSDDSSQASRIAKNKQRRYWLMDVDMSVYVYHYKMQQGKIIYLPIKYSDCFSPCFYDSKKNEITTVNCC